MQVGLLDHVCTQRLLSGEGAASSAKDQDHQECQDQDHMCATHAQPTHAPPHDWRDSGQQLPEADITTNYETI